MDLRSKSSVADTPVLRSKSSVADTPVLRSKSSVADTPVQARKGILKARSSSPVNVSEPSVKTKPLPEPPVAKTKPLPEPSAVKTKPLPKSVSEPSQPDLKKTTEELILEMRCDYESRIDVMQTEISTLKTLVHQVVGALAEKEKRKKFTLLIF
ncbi:unnamed protein product [Caenorhabditis auriculariae]|uniref:Uncharacterized protein n=1 Tax=Caenorhabditis auriculariae TaxID=2777116 RepID=A0A8S1HVX3_9PELO|nr:unnamed protein product [Caenorhabditis auriculariae]